MIKSPSEYLTTVNISPLSRQRPPNPDAGLGGGVFREKSNNIASHVIESSLLKVGNFRGLKGRLGDIWKKGNLRERSPSSVLGVGYI
ncbi:hypothetical protein CEXT_775291 [Caerostris extrusa]|uniref:Uncharacterized protein n=1 Tax=Caerostris extrusa TaxID=172846 RepID=A0AAV4MJR6_CAEEX|nr:hypothetical protein CEXT_775291 [Caerostris extrusa]